MHRITLALVTAIAFAGPAMISSDAHALTLPNLFCWSDCDEHGDDDDNDHGGECHDIDIDVGAKCGVITDLDLELVCDPLSVEAACIAELGIDCGVEAFAACAAELTAQCKADIGLGGALFCDGHYVGPGVCLGGIDVDVDIDADACLDLDVDVDLDLDFDVCLDVDLGLNAACALEVGAECHAACDPIAVELACYGELGYDCELDAFAACQAELLAKCNAECDVKGAVFCDGGVYVGADICIGIGIGIGLGL